MHSTCEPVREVPCEDQHGGKKCSQEKNQFHRPEFQDDMLAGQSARAFQIKP
jgi:hypothetical protein